MPDFRVFCLPPSAEPAQIALSPDESHHLIAVNRARVGDPVIAFDGRGAEWSCVVLHAHKRAATLTVQSRRTVARPAFEIALAQALPKGPAMDAIVRKATEIGVRRIIPLESERTQVHLEGERSDRKLEKWQTAALEAAKQCGNPFLPDILPLQTTTDFLRSSADYDLKLIASLHPGARSLKTLLAERDQPLAAAVRAVWLIGPEGDFSPAEMSAALAAGFAPITLGPLVLRSETAAIYALSILSYELQNR